MKEYILLLGLILAGCTAPAASLLESTSTPASGSLPSAALPEGFDVQGHRGARGLKPENTLPAFETALDLGATTLELDLHYTSDGVVVIWHDDSIEADKCGLDPAAPEPLPPDPEDPTSTLTERMISQLTFEQLQKYRCDRNPAPEKFPEQRNDPTPLAGDRYQIVSLAELFDFVESYGSDPGKSAAQQANARRVQFNIETKRKPGNPRGINDGFDGTNPGPFEQAIVKLVEQRGLVERMIVQSFDPRSLRAVRDLNPALRVAMLTKGYSMPSRLAEEGAAVWLPHAGDLTPALIQEAHSSGLRVIPWTVNDPDEMRRLIEMGVDGLISDRPDVLLALP